MNNMNITKIMFKISFSFDLEEEILNDDRLYRTEEQLNIAFSENVIWEDNTRKRDLGIILYSLGKYILNLNASGILTNIDLDLQLFNFELLLLAIMPSEWRFQIPYKKGNIEPYFYSFTSQQAEDIALFFSFILSHGIFPDMHDELTEVVNFWNSMSSGAYDHPTS